MRTFICRINNHLLSFNPQKNSYDLVSLYHRYDIRDVVRIFIPEDVQSDNNPEITVKCYSNNREHIWTLDDSTKRILFKTDDYSTLNEGILFLDINWAQSPCNTIDAFLNFFPDHAWLPFYGEYGMELVCFLPFIRYLSDTGKLQNRKIETYSGMSSFYSFIDENGYFERNEQRVYLKPDYRFPTPNLNEHGARKSIFEHYRNYRGDTNALDNNKRNLFIQNKFTVEWMKGPINYLPLILLHHIFNKYKEKFNIVYSRPNSKPLTGYSVDENSFCEYPDLAVARLYGITIFEECIGDKDYNLEKMNLLKNTKNFITVQGGGSYVMPMFWDSKIFMLHIEGDELSSGAYTSDGFYSYLSNNTCVMYIARNIEQLWSDIQTNL